MFKCTKTRQIIVFFNSYSLTLSLSACLSVSPSTSLSGVGSSRITTPSLVQFQLRSGNYCNSLLYFMGLCSHRTILYNKRGVFRYLSSVCWEQSHRHTYGVFWPLTRRGSGRFISIQVVNHKTLIHNASCSQQR